MFAKEVVEFSKNLESLRDFVELVDAHLEEKNIAEIKNDAMSLAPLLLLMHKSHPNEFQLEEVVLNKIKDRFGSDIEWIEEERENGKEFKIELNEEAQKKFANAMDKLSKSRKRQSSLYQSSLVTIISYVEWFLAQLIHRYYDKNPGSIGLKDKQLSLNDLYEIGSIDEAKKYLIDTKVEAVLRGSLNDWINFLKDQLNLSMGYLKDYQKVLTEACQRRNLYVHNGGVVNSIYLRNCSFEGMDPPSLGEKLSCDKNYIEKTLSAFEKTFLLIAAELWKKNEPNNANRFHILNSLSYKHIFNERYEIGSSLAYFLCGDKSQKESDRIIAQINYWQAKKWQDDFVSIRKEIEQSDFSAKDTLYILAKHVLLDEYDKAFLLIPDLLKSEKLSFSDLSEWPLFKELRESPRYIDIEREFGATKTEIDENIKLLTTSLLVVE